MSLNSNAKEINYLVRIVSKQLSQLSINCKEKEKRQVIKDNTKHRTSKKKKQEKTFKS